MTERYLTYGQGRGRRIAWKLTDREKGLVLEWMSWAYKVALHCARLWDVDLDDACSAANLALCKAVHYYKPDPEHPLQWAIRERVRDAVAQVNRVGGDRRLRPRGKALPLHLAGADQGTDHLDGKLLWELAEQRLPGRMYALMRAHLREGKSLRAAGRDMGIPPGYVTELYHRAVDLMREAAGG